MATIREERENPVPPEAGVRVAELTHAILEAGQAAPEDRATAVPAT